MKGFLTLLIGVALFGGLCFYVFYKNPQVRDFEQNLARANQGDPVACEQVADNFATGTGTKQDSAQAVKWYKEAASKENAQAMWKLAQIYQKGELVEADADESFVYLQIAAANDEVPAHEELARYYMQGISPAPQHEGEGILWNIRATRLGSEKALKSVQKAQEELPSLYQDVFAFSENLEKAAQGDALAAQEAAFVLRRGETVLKNEEEAFKLFSSAWEKAPTLSASAYELAEMLRLGEGVEKDFNKALHFYGASAALKNPQAQYYLGTRSYEETPANYEDAFAWFSNAAEQGHPAAQYMTGFMLLQGQGTKKSIPLAVEFFGKSAAQNYTSAQYVLGQMYLKGLGVKPNKTLGKKWLEQAAANGNASAQALLESL